MAVTGDLIEFNIIETQKENIQSLPGGRSAKALASTFAPGGRLSGSTPNDTRNLNDAIREEYEIELNSIAESDDPLDVYDRYVKWTLSAYPSAQATPESQLRPLLERATKAFQSTGDYKNDPRYFKLWLNYIRLFSDAPKETFVYLARHNIGERLALFYEEFAAWLEGAQRWAQADEVYTLGLEREARPVERLQRKYGEFKARYDSRPESEAGPSSPALPTMRPALAAKIDPFSLSTPRPADPQAQRHVTGTSTTKGVKPKMAIFSDADAPESALKASLTGGARGWDNIGSVSERRKENVVEAKPWAGETLKAGKRMNGPSKMAIFKDTSSAEHPIVQNPERQNYADLQQVVNPRTGKMERVFVDLAAIYPIANDQSVEISFEELRAESRGWLSRDWSAEKWQEASSLPVESAVETAQSPQRQQHPQEQVEERPETLQETPCPSEETTTSLLTSEPQEQRSRKSGRPKKMKVMEVKAEARTVKANLESPTGPKLRRKNSAEPTMTLHTKAATDDILDIFNQPLRNVGPIGDQAESEAETDYDDDDYTSAGESTGTGHISGTSEYGDETQDVRDATEPKSEETGNASASPWSDFTKSKHVPKLNTTEDNETVDTREPGSEPDLVVFEDQPQENQELSTPVSPEFQSENARTKFIPIPPEDFEAPTHPFRDPVQAAQNRLPFMTPIVEKTESSLGALTIREDKDYFSSKTPCRVGGENLDLNGADEADGDSLSSPLEELINEARPDRHKALRASSAKVAKIQPHQQSRPSGPLISDIQCNPVDDSIRLTILESLSTPLSTYHNFHDHRPQSLNKGPEIRRFIKALTKPKSSSEKTTTNVSLPPVLSFPVSSSQLIPTDPQAYTIKRELGKGAFAPVYLACASAPSDPEPQEENLIAIKCVHPPTPWEFHIMKTLHSRLSEPTPSSNILPSLLLPHSMHLFSDEAYLLLPYHSQGTLVDLVNVSRNAPTDPITGLDEPVAMFFAIELLRAVQAMHTAGILHGDLKADNCLVRLPTLSSHDSQLWDPEYSRHGDQQWSTKGLTLIDFGRGIDTTCFSQNVRFIADWKTSKQDCPEMRELRPWTYQGDYWGMAAIIHTCLFGKYIEDVAVMDCVSPSEDGLDGERLPAGQEVKAGKRYKLRETLKRYWATEIWAPVFDVLMNPGRHIPSSSSPPSSLPATANGCYLSPEELRTRFPAHEALTAVREKMEEWLEREGGKRGLKAGLMRLEGRLKERRGGKGGK